MENDCFVTLRVPKAEKEEWFNKAKEFSVKLSELVRLAVRSYKKESV